jgi:GNAT superfamily N-acetyltransferase
MSHSAADLSFCWADQPELAVQIGAFFSANADAHYISHSELQSGRAIAPGQWDPDLQQMIQAEAEHILQNNTLDGKNDAIACAWLKDQLVGIAFVGFAESKGQRFATLEDMIIAPTVRGMGLGQRFIDWIAASVKDYGVSRIFLESGKGNVDAHHFFEKVGFQLTSVVMMRDL